jgi:hypothetical protein
MANFEKLMTFEELPPSLKIFLRAEALRRNMTPETLLEEILAGKDPIPQHLSEFVRNVWNSRLRGIAE